MLKTLLNNSVKKKNLLLTHQDSMVDELFDVLNYIEHSQNILSKVTKKSKLKLLGQYFTNAQISQIISQLIINKKKKISLVDAGAGMGILSISSIIQLVKGGCKNLSITLYELDRNLIFNLQETFEKVHLILNENQINFEFNILNLDFILNRPDKEDIKYDIVVLNPPYFKINSESNYFNVISDLYSGNPNVYASFVAISLKMLKQGGQLIAITPRSFTNGLYFKNFRNYILNNSNITNIHTFISRNKLFDKVLQEVIIYRLVKGENQSKLIEINISDSHEDLTHPSSLSAKSDVVIDYKGTNKFIRIPEDDNNLELLSFVSDFPNTFNELGYFIATGEVVQYRIKEFVSDSNSKNAIKVFISKDIRPENNILIKTNGLFLKKKKGFESHILKRKNYLILRRFSSKDDKKRLIASLLFSENNENELIGIDNHLNYIGNQVKGNGLNKIEMYGLFALFNSTLYEKYFRCISGNTQVNATEIRQMRFPNKEIINSIGKKMIKMNLNQLNQGEVDLIVNRYFNFKHTI